MDILILGNGITGITAALRLRAKQPDWNIAVISGESTYHYSRPALMYVFMGHQSYQETKPYPDSMWAEKRIELVRDWVTGVDLGEKSVTLKKGGARRYDKLLIATGSKSNRFGWPGQDLAGVQGLYDLRDLKLLYENVKTARHAVIVGGGLIGIELAEMLHSAGIHVTFLVREESYWSSVLPPEESAMVSRAIEREDGLRALYQTELEAIEDDGAGRCSAITTKAGERIECQIVGLTAGVRPRIELFEGTDLRTGRGILVDWSLRTSVPEVFAAGDCAELVTEGEERNVLQQVWYTGKYQAEVAADVMAGEEREYEVGIWHNSAKFLHVEYQTYGTVPNGPRDGVEQLYWEDREREQSVRLVAEDGVIVGFNLMNVRMRHRVCERWIAERRPLEHVLAHLEEADFDPEFHRRVAPQLRNLAQGVRA